MRVAFLLTCVALIGRSVTASVCGLSNKTWIGDDGFPREAQSIDEQKFLVNVECQPHGLEVKWQLTSDAEDRYAASVNYACTYNDGTVIYTSNLGTFNTKGARQGTIDTSSAPIQDILENGGMCIAFGCNRDQLDGRPFLFNQNVSCNYSAAGESTSAPTTDSIDHTQADTVPTPGPATSPQGVTTSLPLPEVASTLTSHTHTTEVTATPFPTTIDNETKNSNHPVIIIIIIIIVVITVIIVLAMVGILIKKKAMKNPRLKNLGSILNIEKIDPYYTPIQVEPGIRKYESMGSIFDHLTRHPNEPQFFALPPHQPTDSKNELGPYALPLHSTYSVIRTDSLESSSSDYHSSTTSLSTLPQLGDVTLLHLKATNNVMELMEFSDGSAQGAVSFTSTLFEQEVCDDSSSSFEDSCSSVATTNTQITSSQSGGYMQEPKCGLVSHTKDFLHEESIITDTLDEDENRNIEKNVQDSLDEAGKSKCLLDTTPENRVILTFSSPSTSYGDVIVVEPKTHNFTHGHMFSNTRTPHLAEEGLTSLNLTINPHHFDPLDHFSQDRY